MTFGVSAYLISNWKTNYQNLHRLSLDKMWNIPGKLVSTTVKKSELWDKQWFTLTKKDFHNKPVKKTRNNMS